MAVMSGLDREVTPQSTGFTYWVSPANGSPGGIYLGLVDLDSLHTRILDEGSVNGR